MHGSVCPRSQSPVPKRVLHPSQDGFLLEAPSIKHSRALAQDVVVGDPKEQHAILVRDAGDVDGADRINRHLRIGMRGAVRRVLAAQLIGPRWISDDDAIRSLIRQRRRLGADRCRLQHYLHPFEWPMHIAGAGPCRRESSAAVRLPGSARSAWTDGGRFIQRPRTEAGIASDLVAGLALITSGNLPGVFAWRGATVLALPRLCLGLDLRRDGLGDRVGFGDCEVSYGRSSRHARRTRSHRDQRR